MKHNIKEYKINQEKSGRVTLKLELELYKLGDKRATFGTNDAMVLIVADGWCDSTNDLEAIKHGLAYNWGGSPNKADWTFRVRGTNKTTAKKQPVKAVADTKKEPANKEPANKEPAKKVKTTNKKTIRPKTTQDILANIKSKGN